MGYVVLTMYLRPSNYSAGHKTLERVPSNSSNHYRRSSRRWTSMHSELTPFSLRDSSFFLDIQNRNTIVTAYKRPAMSSLSWFQLVVDSSVFTNADLAIIRSTHSINVVRPAHLSSAYITLHSTELYTLSLSLTKDAVTTLAGMIM